jgi:hypothetical protein
MLRFRAAILPALLLLGASSASAITLDFENFTHGQVVSATRSATR